MNRPAAPVPTGPHAHPTPVFALAFGIALFIALAFVNRSLLSAPLFETGDLAANSLLGLEARKLHLLTGPFSRVGFFHPGPFMIDVLAFGEWLFHDLLHVVRSPITGQLLALYLYNAGWTALTFWLLARILDSNALAGAATAIFVALATLQDPQFIESLWLPYLYYFPFAAYTAACARVAMGRFGEIWALVLAGSALVHGHASFGAIVPIMLAGCLLVHATAVVRREGMAGLRAHAREQVAAHRKAFIAAVAIAAVFALPIVLETIIHFPGQIPRYVGYGHTFPGNRLGDALAFVGFYWAATPFAALLAGMALLGLLWAAARGPDAQPPLASPELRGLAWSVAFATVAVTIYAKTGIDSLDMKYIGLFYFAAVALALAAAATLVASFVPFPGIAVLALFIAGLVVTGSKLVPMAPENDAAVPAMVAKVRSIPRPPAVLDLDMGESWQRLWSLVVGMAAYSARDGQRPLCVNRNWQMLFTEHFRCTAADLRQGTEYFATLRPLPPGANVLKVGELNLFVPPTALDMPSAVPVMLVGDNPLAVLPLLGEGWASPEHDFTWTTGPRASLRFRVDRPGPFTLELDTAAYLPRPDSTQRVVVKVNGTEVGALEYDTAHNRALRTIEVPARLVGSDRIVRLELDVSQPRSPSSFGNSADMRPLGIAVRSIRVVRPAG